MPYIDKKDRKSIYIGRSPKTAGELNYSITKILIDYLDSKNECYQTYNDILGALEGAKLEIYRRKIGFYEDEKIEQNGDVY